MNTIDVIEELISNIKDIRCLTFSKYPKQTLIQDTIELSEDDEKLMSSALLIRNKLKMPFWDALMVSCFDKDNVSENILKRALLHNSNKIIFQTNDLNQIRNYLNSNQQENISLNSTTLMCDGSIKHFFLLDFHIFPSENNLNIITTILNLLNLHGYVLISGESYHFVSDSLIEENMLLDLLAKSLLFSPIVDRAWVAHQLLERSCSIRVSKKHDLIPNVIKKV